MAFKGDLQSVPLGDVLQTLAQGNKKGTLQLKGQDYKTSLYCCSEGITLLQPGILMKRRFGDIVVSAGLVDRKTLEDVIKAAPEGEKVGTMLINAGIIDENTAIRIVTIQVEEEIFSLFERSAGEFEFFEGEDDAAAVEEKSLPLFQVEGLLLEAARRQDEWRYIRERINDLDTVFFPVPGQEGVDDPKILHVFQQVDGRKTVRNISDSILASPFDVAKIMSVLVEDGKIRAADKEELLTLAQDLLDCGDIDTAGTILKKLRPNLKNIILDEGDVSALSNLFYKVGDILTATNILLEKVRQSKEASVIEESLPFLKQAHRIAPEDTRILNELANTYNKIGDREGGIQYQVSLLEVHSKAGRFDHALEVYEEIQKLEPNNTALLDRLPDFVIGAEDKQAAISFLEEVAERIGKKADPKHLLGIYRQIIKLDPARKGIKEKLQKAQRAYQGSKRKVIHLVGFFIVLVGGAASWYLNFTDRKSDMDRVAYATMKFVGGDLEGAREAIMEVMASIQDPDALSEAESLVAHIDHRLNQGDEIQVEILTKEYYDRRKIIRGLMDKWRYGQAFLDLKALTTEFDVKKFGKATDEEAAKIAALLRADVVRFQEQISEFTVPTLDEEIAPTLNRFKPLISVEKSEALRSSVQVLKDFHEAGVFANAISAELIELVESTAQDAEQLSVDLLGIEERLERLNDLAALDQLLAQALRAEEEERLDDALELYTRLVEGYGEGSLKGSQKEAFNKKKIALEGFFSAVRNAEALANAGQIEEGHHQAFDLLTRHKGRAEIHYIRVPVKVTSVPDGAVIRSQNREIGRTPKLLYLQRGDCVEVSLDYAGYDRKTFVIDKEGGAVQQFTLNREVLFSVKLGGLVEGQPLIEKDTLLAGTRSGIIFRIDLESGGILQKFKTGSLSGIPASVTEAHGNLYFITMEGELWCITSQDLELLNKTGLPSGTKSPPLATPGGILTACTNGDLVLHDPDLNTKLWTYKGKGKIVVDPIVMEGRVMAAFTSREVHCLDLKQGTVLWRVGTGSGGISGLARANGSIFLTTKDGCVKCLDAQSGAERWSVDMESFIGLAPVVSDGRVFIAANKEVVALDVKGGKELARYHTGEVISSLPAVEGDNLCFGTKEGNLHYWRVADGEPIWVYHTSDAITAPPVLTEDRVIVSDGEGRLSAIVR